jgi:tetratricopeptide (TPR) repeat protein
MAVYDAFISYSHLKDKPIAAALQSAIQKLGKPWYQRRALRLFRDDTSLSATPHLWPMIEQALGHSRHFLLLASPEAAASKWVNKEVAFWLEHNSIDTLLIGLTDGELFWDDAAGDFTARDDKGIPLPPALPKRFPSEPKWVDLRPYREGADRAANKRDAKFTELAADFAAAIRGMPKEDLLSQEVRQQRRALRLAVGAAAALLMLAVAAAGAGILAYRAEQQAKRTLAQATDTANSLVFNLAQRFRFATGVPVTLVKDILDRALALQQQLVSSGQITPDLQFSEAAALQQSAFLLQAIGDTASAYKAADRSRQIMEQLVASFPDRAAWRENLFMVYATLGRVLVDMGKRDEAQAEYQNAKHTITDLLKGAPENSDYQRDLSAIDNRIGDLLVSAGRRDDALAAYQDGLAIMKKVAAVAHDNLPWQRDLAVSYEKVGELLASLARLPEALASYRAALNIMQTIADKMPDNGEVRRDQSLLNNKIGDVLRAMGQNDGAMAAYQKGLALIENLAAGDANDAEWQDDLSVSYEKVGDMLLTSKEAKQALAMYQKSRSIRQKLVDKDPNNTMRRRDLSVSDNKIGDAEYTLGSLDEALQAYRRSLTVREQLVTSDAGNAAWQHDLRFTALRIGGLAFSLVLHREFATALDASEQAISIAPDVIWINSNRAHALMFLGRIEEARTVYLKYRGVKDVQDGKPWDRVILEDFADLRKNGLTNPLMDEIEKLFTSAG